MNNPPELAPLNVRAHELADVLMAGIGDRLRFSQSPLIGWYLDGPEPTRVLMSTIIGRTYRYHHRDGQTTPGDSSEFRRAVEKELKARPGVRVRAKDMDSTFRARLQRSNQLASGGIPRGSLPGF